MNNKFTKEYIKELLSKEFKYENFSIYSSYGFDCNMNYDKATIVDIFNNYEGDYTSISLAEVKELKDFLIDLIEYYERFDNNPMLLTVEDKKKLLIKKIQEDDANYALSISLNELSEDKLDKILKHLKLT